MKCSKAIPHNVDLCFANDPVFGADPWVGHPAAAQQGGVLVAVQFGMPVQAGGNVGQWP